MKRIDVTFGSFFSVIMCLLLLSTPLSARTITEEEIKAKFILNFARFTDFPNIKDKLNICLISNDITRSFLEEHNKNITLKYTVNITSKSPRDEFNDCNILYISEEYKSDGEIIIDKTNGTPILTISDIANFSSFRGIITIQLNNEGSKIRVNITSLKASTLTISSNLLSIVEIVE